MTKSSIVTLYTSTPLVITNVFYNITRDLLLSLEEYGRYYKEIYRTGVLFTIIIQKEIPQCFMH